MNSAIDKNFKLTRLGLYNVNKNRPLRVILKSPEDSTWIILNNKDIIEKLNIKIKITDDETTLEMQQYKTVRAQLNEVNKNKSEDEKYVIRYINSIPKIVKNSKNDQEVNQEEDP